MLSSESDGTCALAEHGPTIPVPVSGKRSVTYEFDTTATTPDLALPYAVMVNGQALPAYEKKPKALSKGNRKISLLVDAGSTVGLFLNSDAHPSFRKQPVYEVKVGERDVLVKITERKGRISHERTILGLPVCQTAPGSGKTVELYRAALTGDIWMQISHIYTEEEADALLPQEIDNVIRAAVRMIYRGLPTAQLTVAFGPTPSLPARRTTVTFEEQDSVRNNTSYCSHLRGVLPRTHPRAMAAMLAAARDTGLTSLRVTSCWRPSLGSIVHRAGLGLDVVYIRNVATELTIERASLKTSSQGKNLSAEEHECYSRYEAAKAEAAHRLNEFQVLMKSHGSAQASDVDGRRELNAARDRLRAAAEHENQLLRDWERILERDEPESIRTFRDHLAKSPLVQQLFDPWYMDSDTSDSIAAVPNEYLSKNENTHGDHLHITVREPQIL